MCRILVFRVLSLEFMNSAAAVEEGLAECGGKYVCQPCSRETKAGNVKRLTETTKRAWKDRE